jgi:hypothetical protein
MVAIAGGNSDGIEVWNPSVTTLNSTFPLRERERERERKREKERERERKRERKREKERERERKSNGSVTILNLTFPLSAMHPMIGVNGNTELIYYDSRNGVGSPKGIWKFTEVTNTWTKLGEMMNRRAGFSALPVDGFTCP